MLAIASYVVYCSPPPLAQLLTLQHLQGLTLFTGRKYSCILARIYVVLLLHLCFGLLRHLSSLSRKEGNNESLPESNFSFTEIFGENKSLFGSVKTELRMLQLKVAAVICFS